MDEMLNGRVPANPECYMYSFYEQSVKDYPDNITITSMGVKIKVKEFIQRRNLCAKGLLEYGVRPGEIVSVADGITVATGIGALRILELQKPGKNKMPWKVFLQSFPLSAGEIFK